MYQQIAAALCEEIEPGKLKPGQQLPTEPELRDLFGASRNIVRDAIKVRQHGRTPSLSEAQVEIQEESAGIAAELGLEEGAVRYLAYTLGLRQKGCRDWITVRAPDETEALFFKLPPNGRVPVFEFFRTAFDQTGTYRSPKGQQRAEVTRPRLLDTRESLLLGGPVF